MQRGLQRRMLLACGGLALLVGAAFVVLIATLLSARSTQAARTRSEQVIAQANLLEQQVLNLETDARRFAITHHGVYLHPLVAANQNLTVTANRLVVLDSDNRTNAQRLRTAVQLYAQTYATLVITAAARDPATARTLVLQGADERQFERLQQQFATYRNHEQAESDEARTRADHQESLAIVVGAVGLVGSLFLIGVFGLFVVRRVIDPVRRVAHATERLASGELGERVEAGGRDEIGELGRNFNTMAESIETQQRELAGQNRDLERLATVLRSVLDSTVDGIVLTDMHGNVQLANRPLRRFAEELGLAGRGKVVDQLLAAADRMADKERYIETMERLRDHPDEPSADEFELSDPYRVFIGFTSPVRGDDGGLMGRIWTLREVTQERELDRLKDDFVATVSHELRTPLTSMMGFLEIVRDGEAGDLNDEQKRFLSIVHRSSERLQRLVGDLLFVARLDASGLDLRLEHQVPLGEIVTEAVESASAYARSRKVTLRAEPDRDVRIRADRERISQLVGNLISNGLKFTPAGGAVTARVFAENGHAVLEIEDTGIGIPYAEQERLFQRFFRSSNATEQAIPGTGLGLAITKAIAEAHDGSMSVRSTPGEGTCFRLELPLDE
jgi:signal transduction histidine kinase